RYYELLSFKSLENIANLKQDVAAGANPRDIKIELAKELIERFHSIVAAESAHQVFIQSFQKNQIPDDINVVELNHELPIAILLKEAGLVASTSEANRM
ncbi:tyrosine--tRNA ligase, partial [Francisella tularensis subsp. holarctica]|nr:tyrosine--tRNA ligase [Francisella tularensis subsp. holarctica]